MNWETAKNWLIAAFLILDLLLGWQIWQSRRELAGYVESYSDLLANTKTLLAEHGLSLDTGIPENQPDLPFLKAAYATPKLSELARTLFSGAKWISVDNNTGTAESDAGSLKIVDAGVWKVKYNTPGRFVSAEPADILKWVWGGSNYAYDPYVSDTSGHATPVSAVWVFLQRYNGYPLFDTPLEVQVDAGNLAELDQSFVTDIAPQGDTRPIISALDALNNLANVVDKTGSPKDNRILSIQLGYYHKSPNAGEDAGNIPATPYWFPVWRIVTTQQIYYVNAFTGEVDLSS